MLPKWCIASRMAFMKQMWIVRVESNCPRLCLLWEVVHPIRRHCTSSDRVYRDVTGASLRNGCFATERVQRLSCGPRAAGVECVGDRLKLRPWVGVDAANAHRPPCASRSDVRQRRSREVPEGYTQQGRGPSLAARAPPIAVRTQYDRRASRRRYA